LPVHEEKSDGSHDGEEKEEDEGGENCDGRSRRAFGFSQGVQLLRVKVS